MGNIKPPKATIFTSHASDGRDFLKISLLNLGKLSVIVRNSEGKNFITTSNKAPRTIMKDWNMHADDRSYTPAEPGPRRLERDFWWDDEKKKILTPEPLLPEAVENAVIIAVNDFLNQDIPENIMVEMINSGHLDHKMLNLYGKFEESGLLRLTNELDAVYEQEMPEMEAGVGTAEVNESWGNW